MFARLKGFGVEPDLGLLRTPETDLLRFAKRAAVILVLTNKDLWSPPGKAFATLHDDLTSATNAVSENSGAKLMVLLVGVSRLDWQTPRSGPRQVNWRQIDSESMLDLQAAVDGLGLKLDDLPTGHDVPPASTPSVRANVRTVAQPGFVRPEELPLVEAGLASSRPVTAVVGPKGVGKSTIARQVVSRVAEGVTSLPFEYVVWVSDEASPGTVNLSRVLDECADVLGFPGLKSMAVKEKARRVHDLCSRLPTLLVIDNIDRVYDPEFFGWLCDLPSESKALVTSRQLAEPLANSQVAVSVGGLDRLKAIEFSTHLAQQLGSSPKDLPDALAEAIWQETKGNAKAIQIALAQILSLKRPSEDVVEELRGDDDSFTRLIAGSWDILGEDDQRVLFALSLLPFGADDALLSRVTGTAMRALKKSLRLLSQVSMCESRLTENNSADDNVTLYTLGPLVQTFVNSMREGSPQVVDDLKNRVIQQLKRKAAEVGFCPGSVTDLDVLDFPQLLRNIEATIAWCMEENRDADVISLTRDVRYYYYVRGIWSPDPNPHLQRAEAARNIRDESEELDALLYYCNIAAKQENREGFETQQPQLETLMKRVPPGSVRLRQYAHVKALFKLLVEGDSVEAIRLWQANLAADALEPRDESAYRRWLGVAYLRNGDTTKAREQLTDALAFDRAKGFDRGVIGAELHLVRTDLVEAKEGRGPGRAQVAARVRSQLATIQSELENVDDGYYKATWYELSGRLAVLENDSASAKKLLAVSNELYERLGFGPRLFDIPG